MDKNRRLIKFIILFLFLMFVVGCSTLNKTTPSWMEIGKDGIMLCIIDSTFTSKQLDSLCVSDSIIYNMKKWNKIVTYDDKTKKPIEQYIYRKKYKEITYVVTPIENGKYKVIKRIIEN